MKILCLEMSSTILLSDLIMQIVDFQIFFKVLCIIVEQLLKSLFYRSLLYTMSINLIKYSKHVTFDILQLANRFLLKKIINRHLFVLFLIRGQNLNQVLAFFPSGYRI